MNTSEITKKNVLNRLFGEFKNTVVLYVTVSLIPLMIIIFLRDFLPGLATYRITSLTYSDIIGFIGFISIISPASLIYTSVILNRPVKPAVYNNGKNTSRSKRIKEYAKEATNHPVSVSNMNERKKVVLVRIFFLFPSLNCIVGIFSFLVTLKIVFRPYILIMLISGIFLTAMGFRIKNSKRSFPFTANGFDYSDDNKRKKLNLFTSNVWILCGAFLINGIFLKGYIFLACAIIVSGVVPFLYSYSIKN